MNAFPTPEYHSIEEYQNRVKKLAELQKLGIDPYPHKFSPKDRAAHLAEQYGNEPIGDSELAAQGESPPASIAGRLVLFRGMGKNAFAQIQDGTGRIQVMLNRDLTTLTGYEKSNDNDPAPIKIIEKKIDLGDFVGFEGHLFHTNKGELTLFVKKATLLCKSLLPLPDKHSGLNDKELRYRKRWLDLISNQEVRDTFTRRSMILKIIRSYLEEHEFIEVETPVLQSIYGGAAARPFKTEFHALDDQEMFLRVSLELPLKKLLAGGIEKVFEIGRVFRNEGIDKNHNPEFTLLEAYAAYWDYNDMMVFVETLFEKLALHFFGSTQIPYHGLTIEMKAPWKRITMKDSLIEYAGIDTDKLSNEEMRNLLVADSHYKADDVAKLPKGLLIFKLFEEKVEDKLLQPHHITDHPIETTPLCKLHRKPEEKEQGIVERFESFIAGKELCNAYSELNDPILQRKLLLAQAKQRDAGDAEAMPLDEEFIEAVCQGMPPNSGVGIGLDRLVMFFTEAASIRDVLFFPFMKANT